MRHNNPLISSAELGVFCDLAAYRRSRCVPSVQSWAVRARKSGPLGTLTVNFRAAARRVPEVAPVAAVVVAPRCSLAPWVGDTPVPVVAAPPRPSWRWAATRSPPAIAAPAMCTLAPGHASASCPPAASPHRLEGRAAYRKLPRRCSWDPSQWPSWVVQLRAWSEGVDAVLMSSTRVLDHSSRPRDDLRAACWAR
jgi:hypothetical protein